MTQNQLIQIFIIIVLPAAMALTYVAYKEKSYKTFTLALLQFALTNLYIVGTFAILVQKGAIALAPEITLAYVLAALMNIVSVVTKPRLVEYLIIVLLSLVSIVGFLPKELMIIVATGVLSALIGFCVNKAIVLFPARWQKKK